MPDEQGGRNISFCKQSYKMITISLKLLTILVLRFWQWKSGQDVFVEELADGQRKMHD